METKTMAELFVRYHTDWQSRDVSQKSDLHEYLKTLDLLGNGEGQISFLSWWHCLPKDRSETSVTDYAVMDFEDGSIAIKRNHDYGHEARWLVTL